MQKFILSTVAVLIQLACLAQQQYTSNALNFPEKVKEVIVSEFEINRVTGDKNLFKTMHYFFENGFLKNIITQFDNKKTTTATFSYSQNKLIKYELKDALGIYEELYMYNKKNQISHVKIVTDKIESGNVFLLYDKLNRLAKRIIKEMDGTTSCIETYTYGKKNNFTKKVLFVYQTNFNNKEDEYFYVNNLEVKSITYNDLKKQFVTNKKYDRYNNIISIDNPQTNIVNKYNEADLLIQTNILTNDNLLYTTIEYNYIF